MYLNDKSCILNVVQCSIYGILRAMECLSFLHVIPILNRSDIKAPRKERRRCTVVVHRGADDEGNDDSVELELELRQENAIAVLTRFRKQNKRGKRDDKQHCCKYPDCKLREGL
jgi:hypothetical protein